MTGLLLWLLALVVVVAVIAFYAGWRSASSYLNAARAVSDVTNAVAQQASSYSASLDKATLESASLRAAVENFGGASVRNSDKLETKLGDVEAALLRLFDGFERAGIVRSARSGPGAQVGEKRTE